MMTLAIAPGSNITHPPSRSFGKLSALAAAADPTRLAILRQLSAEGRVCACDFTACCDVAQPTVSHHLRVLREAGWVERERQGTSIWYSLRPEAAARLGQLAGQILHGSTGFAGPPGGAGGRR
jgi:ArsR family transcriptional regulator